MNTAREFLLRVEDVFEIQRLGVILAPGLPIDDQRTRALKKINVVLVRPDGSETEHEAEITYPFVVPTPEEPQNICRLPNAKKADVPIGTEVWLLKSTAL